MERLLNGPGWKREEQRYQPSPSSQRYQPSPSSQRYQPSPSSQRYQPSPSSQRYQPSPSSQRIARTPALSRGSGNAASAPAAGHSSRLFSPEMPLRTTNEKELLRGLNERFAGFIEKVRRLESQNRALEEEIEDIRLKAKSATSLAKQYEPELQDLRMQVRDMAMQKHQLELEQKRVQDECKALMEKCEEEARSRGEAEESISALKKYIENAFLSKQAIDREMNALADEIEFQKRNHEAEVTDILTQMKESRVCAEVRGFGKGELTAALRHIRTQLEARAFCPDTYSGQRISKQLVQLTKAAEKDREALIATKAEIRQYKRQLQTKTVELDSFQGMREALEKQLYDLAQRHTADIHHYQDSIRELEQEMKSTKYDMSSHVQEYHDLLNVKMALDAEIYSYRKLLEGEESRYFTLSDGQIPESYIYRQSPIYTLPSVPRVGGVSRKVEPQYKFVEEIITETTSEDIEISDTESDDAEEQRELDQLCSEKENEGVAAESEEHFEEKMPQESDAEDYRDSPNEDQLDNEEKPTENEKQSLKKLKDDAADLINTELAQNKLTASEQTREKDTEKSYNNVDNIVSKTKETGLGTKTEKIQEDRSEDEDVENVALEIKKEKQDVAKEINQDGIKEPKPATHEAVQEPGKSAKQEISAKSENEKAKTKTQHVAEHEGSPTGKTSEKDREISEVKSVEVDTSSADPQPVPQKAETGQETRATSKAESMQSVETAQADAAFVELSTSAQENAVEVQKTLEKVKTEASLNNKIKEIQPKEEKKENSKSETDRVSVKPEKDDDAQSTEEQKTQEIVSKPAAKEPEVEISERKEIQAKDLRGSEKTEGNIELKKTEKEVDQVQIREQAKVSGTETESKEQAQKNAMEDTEDTNTKEDLKTKVTTKSSAIQKHEILKEPKSAEKEIKHEHMSETQVSKDHQTSTDIKEVDRVKPEGHETDNKRSKDVQPEQRLPKTSPEKEQGKDQTTADKDVHEIKDTNTEKSDKTETKQDTTEKKDHEKDPTPLKDSKKPEPPENASSEKKQHNSTKAGVKRTQDTEAVTDNGVNIQYK